MDKQSTNYIVDEYNDGKSAFSIAFKEFRNGPEGRLLTHRDARNRFHEMIKSSVSGSPYRPDTSIYDIMFGTLPDSNKKENTMFRDQCFDIPAPTPQWKAKSTSANIDLQVNMPQAQDPTEKARNRLLERAGQASYEKRDEMRKAFNLVDDREPETLKDFIQRIKDGKFTTELTEKEMAERTFWDVPRMLEEITWRDPSRVADEPGFEAANVLLTNALNDVSDEIIVKTPDQGLESLRAFQAKTFN